MLWISKKSLLAFLSESFDKGVSGSADLPDDYFQDTVIKINGNLKFSQVKLSELQKLPNGRKIVHPLMGEGVVSNGAKLGVVFVSGFKEFSSDNLNIWSFPIAMLGGKY